jgi:hypothetical protein
MQSDSENDGKLLIVSNTFRQRVAMLGEEPAARLTPASLRLPGWVFMLIVWACIVPILNSYGNVLAQTEQLQTDASSDSCPTRLILAQGRRENGSPQTPDIESTFQTLTEEERTWLSRHPVIRVVQDPGWPPIEYADEQGESVGITSDYLTPIEQRSGIKFDRIGNLSWQEAYTRLKRWEIDMTTSVAVTPERTEFWAFTQAYMKIPIVVLARSDVTFIASMRELRGKEVAVVDGYAVCDWIPRDFPGIQLVRVKNTKEALDLLVRGDVLLPDTFGCA